MKIFLTGATGFLGRRVDDLLLDDAHQLTALVRDPARGASLRARGAELVHGDLGDRDALARGMNGADAVMHMAAWYKVGSDDRASAEAVNVDGTRTVFELVRDLKIGRCVYTSTIAIYGDTHGRRVTEEDRPTSPPATLYEETKRRAHLEVFEPMARAGVPALALLPGVIYGPGDHSPVADAVRLWLRGKLPSLPAQTAFSWAHVDDVAAAHVAALTRGRLGESYILAGPMHTMVEVFDLAARVADRPPPRIVMPAPILRAMATLARPLAGRLPPAYHPESLRSIAGVTLAGRSDKAARELGFAPRPLEEGYPEYVRWELAQLDATT